MLELVETLSSSWLTFWVVGLLISYRMIVPARDFLSDRSAEWLARALTRAHGRGARRRFEVAFKRYVDRTFQARLVRRGRLRFRVLRFRRTALISFLTFQLIYWLVALNIGFDVLDVGTADTLRQISTPGHPDYMPALEPVYGLLADEAMFQRMVVGVTLGLLVLGSLTFGLFNMIAD
jgi:hypothetical protein